MARCFTNSVRVSVTGHGTGIPQDLQTKMFDPFTRGGTDSEVRTSGLGLGLYVCTEIMSLHGGTIGVESKPKVGSTFYFEIPKKRVA